MSVTELESKHKKHDIIRGNPCPETLIGIIKTTHKSTKKINGPSMEVPRTETNSSDFYEQCVGKVLGSLNQCSLLRE